MQWSLVFGVTAVVLTTVGIILYNRRRKWKRVGTISKVFLYPVKSMRGFPIPTVTCTRKGFTNGNAYDRSFLVTQPDGNMMTARKEPLLVTINVEVGEGCITLSAPSMPPLKVNMPRDSSEAQHCKVWGENTCGFDCGDDVAEWLSSYLKSTYRLFYHPDKASGREICARDDNCHLQNLGKILYHDSTPCSILSEASVEDLNERLDKKVIVRNFRPNLLITGCKAYEEDTWIHVKVGTAEFRFARNTVRCVLTTVDPTNGVKNPDGNPLKTLKTYRNPGPELRKFYGDSPLFGVSLATAVEGVINVGDAVYAC